MQVSPPRRTLPLFAFLLHIVLVVVAVAVVVLVIPAVVVVANCLLYFDAVGWAAGRASGL